MVDPLRTKRTKIIWQVMATAATIIPAEHHPARVDSAATTFRKGLFPVCATAAELCPPAMIASLRFALSGVRGSVRLPRPALFDRQCHIKQRLTVGDFLDEFRV